MRKFALNRISPTLRFSLSPIEATATDVAMLHFLPLCIPFQLSNPQRAFPRPGYIFPAVYKIPTTQRRFNTEKCSPEANSSARDRGRLVRKKRCVPLMGNARENGLHAVKMAMLESFCKGGKKWR